MPAPGAEWNEEPGFALRTISIASIAAVQVSTATRASTPASQVT